MIPRADITAWRKTAPWPHNIDPFDLALGLEYDPAEAWSRVHEAVVTRLPGDGWKGDGDAP